MNRYSQFGEEEIIQNYFPKDYIGSCIDIGASNGILINNTKLFEELGWYCLCVEPNPHYFKELQANRLHAVECAISDNETITTFNVVNLGGDCEDAISSLEIDEKLLTQFKGNYDVRVYPITIKVMTLDNCIKEFYKNDKIDFISIDTEGTELDILKSFSIEKWKPKLFVVENNFNEPDVEIYLNLYDYAKVTRLGVNDFYLKN